MSLDNLQRRIDKMLAAIEQQIPAQSNEPVFRIHLFSPQEQSRLQSFLLLHNITRNRFRESMSELSSVELDEIGNWLRLEQALDGEDIAAAAKYRCYLAPGYQEQLLERFLALDENSIPDFDQAPKYIDRHGTQYTLYRTQFRSTRMIIQIHLKRGSLLPGDLEDMRMWLDTFSPGPGPLVA